MIIRPAKSTDAAGVANLWNVMIRETLATFTTEEKPVETIAELIAKRHESFWVADSDGLQGFVTFGAFRSGPGYAATVEHSIVLAKSAQGVGLGRKLMQTAQAAARDQGVHVIVAAISGANPAAIGFHKAIGFKQTGHLPEVGQKAGQWLDLILMQKRLT